MRNPYPFQTLRAAAISFPVVAGLTISTGVYAQEIALSPSLNGAVSIVPRISITETFTDNVRLSSVNQQAEQITEISPGLRIVANGTRLKSYFDYSLNELVYAQASSPRRTLNALNTFGTFEAVDNWAFVDFSGFISQQAISAFGTPITDSRFINSNQAEVATYRISPYVRGRFGNFANYEARYSRSITRSDAPPGLGVTSTDAIGKISSDSTFNSFGWSVDANQQTVDYNTGRPTEADRLNLGLSYRITPQFNLFVNAGREANNYLTLDKKSYGSRGFGGRWAPSERTMLSASWDRRSFGESHSLSFDHRTARTAWRFSDTKGVSTTPIQAGVNNLGLNYDILYNQFASLEPDPVARAQLVNAFLQTNGINPNATATRGFLTSAVNLERRQDLLFSLLGIRDTITFIATRSENKRLDTLSTGIDDLTTSSLVRQRGFSANYAHRLTPDYSLSMLASQQYTSGSLNFQDATVRFININLTGRLGKKSFASIGARHSLVATGTSGSYSENSVFANLNVQF